MLLDTVQDKDAKEGHWDQIPSIKLAIDGGMEGLVRGVSVHLATLLVVTAHTNKLLNEAPFDNAVFPGATQIVHASSHSVCNCSSLGFFDSGKIFGCAVLMHQLGQAIYKMFPNAAERSFYVSQQKSCDQRWITQMMMQLSENAAGLTYNVCLFSHHSKIAEIAPSSGLTHTRLCGV
ncbi:hypothetical protein GQ54DRAFT_298037 [Martensiomyces pterosporus]|nr:hypothetical protein GQ54DRAFT_298037 [Martensiomyces pterosporus]